MTTKPDYIALLAPATQRMMQEIARRLVDRFTGEMLLRCNDGGVRLLRVTDEIRPNELGD